MYKDFDQNKKRKLWPNRDQTKEHTHIKSRLSIGKPMDKVGLLKTNPWGMSSPQDLASKGARDSDGNPHIVVLAKPSTLMKMGTP